MKKLTRRGMSLLEVVISSAILASMILVVMGVLHRTVSTAEDSTTLSELEMKGKLLVDRVRQEIQYSKILATTNEVVGPPYYHDHSGLRFQVTSSTLGQYGFRSYGGTTWVLNQSAILRYEASIAIREPLGVVAPTTLPTIPAGIEIRPVSRDLNQDGDTNDVFYLGSLVMVFMNEFGVVTGKVTLNNSEVLLTRSPDDQADLDGDLNQDGVLDQLFTLIDEGNGEVPNSGISASARKVRVNLWLGRIDYRRVKLIRVNTLQDIRLDNPQ